jgi:signal transduction histidine kinase
MNYLSLISGEENRDAVADMKTVCFRLARIVETLISGTRLSDASLTANMQQTPINELVELHLEKFKEEADQKNLTLTVEDRLQSPIVSTDRQFLSIALDSLIDNAVKFNQEAGAVRIGLEKRSMNGRPFISISIADQGLGISDASKAGLFEDFTQGESHLTRRFGGMGVGLFMAKRAMELLGGCITVDSVDGEGSCFTLLIPADATGAL